MTMSALTVEEKNDSLIEHALKMRSAWSLSNYHSFFQLYSTAPNMGGYLLDLFVQRERERAIKTLIKSWVISFFVLGPRQPGIFCCKDDTSSNIKPFIRYIKCPRRASLQKINNFIMMMKIGLSNVLLPKLFIFVNNIVQYCGQL